MLSIDTWMLVVIGLLLLSVGIAFGVWWVKRKSHSQPTTEISTEETPVPLIDAEREPDLLLEQLEQAKEDTESQSEYVAVPAVSKEKVSPDTEVSEPETELESPESLSGRMVRLRDRLARSGSFGQMLLSVFGQGDLSIDDWEEIEDTLIMADLGMNATEELIDYLRTQAKVLGTSDSEKIKEVLQTKLLELVNPDWDRSLNLIQEEPAVGKPAVIMAVGVNGTGKTTTVGKLARILVAENRKVLMGAADTFRAAAAEQLQTWGERVGVEVVKSDKEGADPASVAFEAVKVGIDKSQDVVLIDTAGRLQNKKDLMDELGKVKRVVEKSVPVTETLLVLDATTGQNGMQQAKVFAEVVDITGIVLTKLDGTAKGGIVVSVQRELGVPVKLIGLGEGPDDLAPFDPEEFVSALLK